MLTAAEDGSDAASITTKKIIFLQLCILDVTCIIWSVLVLLCPSGLCLLSDVMQQHICSQDPETGEWIHFLFFFFLSFPPSSVCPFVPSRSSGVRREGSRSWDETRAEGTEGRHQYACWQERERWSRKIMKFPSLKKKKKKKRNRKTRKENEAAPKYLHFLLPMFDILSFCTCCFSLEVTEKV